MTITTEKETITDQAGSDVNLIFETIERAIRARLDNFDVHTTKYHPVVAGWMRRALRQDLARLEELKKKMVHT